MAKTWQNVLDEARVILKDQQSPERYTDEVLLGILNRGLLELRRLRPDAFWELFEDDDVVVPEIVVVDADPDDEPDEFDPDEDGQIALTATFNIDTMFYTALVYWVSASAELVDDEFSEDGRAALLLGQFKTMVVAL